jgi:hypothetical protein
LRLCAFALKKTQPKELSPSDSSSNAFSRFLAEGSWCADQVGQVLFTLLLPFLSKEILAAVDDTLCRKGGPHLWGGVQHDAVRWTYGRFTSAGRHVALSFGHNWVVVSVWVPLPWAEDRGLAVPVLFRLYRSKSRCPKSDYRKRTELAGDLLRILAGWVPEGRTLHAVANSEYSSRTVFRLLPEGVRFTGSMAMDAALFARPPKYRGKGRPRVKGKRLPSPEKLAKSKAKSQPWKRLMLRIYGRTVTLLVKTRVCLWYRVAGGAPVRVVVTRDPKGRYKDRAYFCTDPSLSVEEILVRYARRWATEATFRNVKQSMGLSDPQNGWWRRKQGTRRAKKKAGPNARGNRGRLAVERTAPLCFLAYGITVVWYLRHGKPQEDVARAMAEAPWYTHKRQPSFSDMLAALRRHLWASRLSGEAQRARMRPCWWQCSSASAIGTSSLATWTGSMGLSVRTTVCGSSPATNSSARNA